VESKVISITKELSLVDQLPNAAHIDVHTVAALFGCKVPTIWARLRRGEIVAPRKFGAHTRWNLGQIREALKGDKPNLNLTTELKQKKSRAPLDKPILRQVQRFTRKGKLVATL
jgi:predicted DNA-binding transcriptional regulator AlpA